MNLFSHHHSSLPSCSAALNANMAFNVFKILVLAITIAMVTMMIKPVSAAPTDGSAPSKQIEKDLKKKLGVGVYAMSLTVLHNTALLNTHLQEMVMVHSRPSI